MNSIDDILSGNKVLISCKEDLDYTIEKLEKYEHKGIVITGSNPWLVSIVKNEATYFPYDYLKIGKYYRVHSPSSYDAEINDKKVSLNNKILKLIDNDNITNVWKFLTEDGIVIGNYLNPTYLCHPHKYFEEVEEPLGFVKKVLIQSQLVEFSFYKELNSGAIIFVDISGSLQIIKHGELYMPVTSFRRFVELKPNWGEV